MLIEISYQRNTSGFIGFKKVNVDGSSVNTGVIMDIPTLFFEDHPSPMFIFDTDTLEILEVNKSAAKKYGFSRDEFRQLTIEDIRPPEDIPMLHKKLKEQGNKSRTYDIGTLRHRTKEGEILYVQIATQVFPMDERNAKIVHIHDISETIRLKKEIEESYRDQRQHIENNPLGMVKYDNNFRILEWSQRAEEKTGYTKDEMLGASLVEKDLFAEGENEEIKRRLEKLSSGKKSKDRFETAIDLKDGSKMDVLIHASALRSKKGTLKSVLAFIENISDRKEYERELIRREKKYHRLFEDANDGIFLMDGMTIIDCNRRVSEMVGYDKDEIIGKTPLSFSPEYQPDGVLSKEKAEEKITETIEGASQKFEWTHEKKSGDIVKTEVSLNAISLDENIFIQAILRDLTQRKKVQAELEDERQRLERAQSLARIGWWSYEAEENKVIWSDALFDILDVDKKDFGNTFEAFYELVHPDDRSTFEDVMSQAGKTEEPLDYMLRIGKPGDEDILYAKCRAESRFDSEGNMIRMSGVLQDVTEQQKAQQELKRRERLFTSLFEDSPVAIVMIDTDGKVQQLNKSFEDLFGYSEEQLRGEDLLKHQLPEERHDEIDKIYGNVFSAEGSSKYYEDTRVTKAGEAKHLLVGALPVKINGEAIGAFGIYTDITKLRRTESNLKKSLKEKEILLSEIHHRVKNNLAIISGLLLLEAMNWDEDTAVHEVLMQSKLRIHSMAKIHEKLYKSEDFANLNLENYVEELVETISTNMNGDGKDVEINIDCDEIYLNINQALPSALIINELVTNSFKYAFHEGEDNKLEVKFKQQGENINILVADNGSGLPKDFEVMAEHSLGYQLVNQLVKQLDAEINVKTAENEGVCYEIVFERAEKSGSASSYFV
ncbi:PAS domain S-box protein [Fodinibius sp. Rm-B-1B1-1]|uniref:PAS domain S-box protein n=1 Tax=Fodinibius alkaliphilus TaxID=3140241 RepID=UPI00315A1DB4